MKMYLLSILFIICGNSYANSDSRPDDYSYQDVIKYREMLNKIPEDMFLKNTISSWYSIPSKINESVTLRSNDIILKDDNTITVWFTQKISKEGTYNQIKLRAGDNLKHQYRIDCYNYSAAPLNAILYRGEKVLASNKNPNPTFNDIIPQSILASAATRACMFQTLLERKKHLQVDNQ